ncbi:endonuclease/exonuclease/phosphatase family metal-dependent hydrolase [Nocardia sp. GP40]|uniref:endonuclease/exonuclease/phosphatase family protein n=2 Tax=unclassified Nocardia TaxID=2637762 RepID=UPI003D1B88E9
MSQTPTTVTVISWNVAEYVRPGKAQERQLLVEQAIRDERPVVTLLQEIYAPTVEEARSRVRSLAQATGLACELPDGQVAVAFGGHEMHAAILWDSEQVSPVAGTWRFAGELWHAMVVGTVSIGGIEISVAAYQAPSLGKGKRAEEAERVMLVATSGFTRDALMICGDFNSLSNARTPEGTYYDNDPYEGKPPSPEHVFQVAWTESADGEITDVHVNRRPAEILSYGGLLHDAAASLGGEWRPTIGHWYPDGPHSLRRIDLAWVTTPMLPAILSCEPVSTPITRQGSDHLPLKVVVDLPILRQRLAALAVQKADRA